MCAHSSSANEVVEKIARQLYPFIAKKFVELREYNKAHNPCSNAALLYEIVQGLKHEFESLSNYETKLVFPAVQAVFDTKDNPDFNPTVNIDELQQLTQKKETLIREFVEDLQLEAEMLSLKKGHPIYSIIQVFTESFVAEKAQWNRMLLSWNKGCACFAKANNATAKGNQLSNSTRLHGTR